MTGKQYAEKKYGPMANRNWLDIAAKAFDAGKEQQEASMKAFLLSNKLFAELEELRAYKKDMEDCLENPERLADLIGGL